MAWGAPNKEHSNTTCNPVIVAVTNMFMSLHAFASSHGAAFKCSFVYVLCRENGTPGGVSQSWHTKGMLETIRTPKHPLHGSAHILLSRNTRKRHETLVRIPSISSLLCMSSMSLS
jgi:hypothetical protein